MIGAALLAKKAVEKGLTRKPWVKTTLAPGSKVVTDYYDRAGLTPYLDKLGFNLVGYGCTTCIGNSGPLPEEVSSGGQRGRPRRRLGAVRQPQLRGPDQPGRQDELPGVAAAGGRLRARRLDGHRPHRDPLGTDQDGKPVYLRRHLAVAGRRSTRSSPPRSARRCSRATTPTSSPATSAGRRCRPRPATPSSGTRDSTYVRKPPYFDGMPTEPTPVTDIAGARVLAKLGDSVTTDHISPAGTIKADSPAGAVPDRARRRRAGTSTPTARAAATTR